MNLLWIIIIAIVILIIYAAVHSNKVRNFDKRTKLEDEWGKFGNTDYLADDFENITHYYKLDKDEGYSVDDITWNDLDMDRIYKSLDTCESSVGREYLYKSLRRPLLDKQKIKDIGNIADWANSNEKDRTTLKMCISKLGFVHKVSFSDYIDSVAQMPQVSVSPSILLMVMNIVCLLFMMFVNAQMGVLALLASLLITVGYYFKKRPEIEPYFICLGQISRMTRTGRKIYKESEKFTDVPDKLNKILTETKRHSDNLKSCIKNDWLLPESSATASVVEVIMSYIRMITHVDLIHYNKAIKGFKGKEDDIKGLMDNIGYLETAMCTASFRVALPYYSEPEFIQDNTGITVEDMYHPMINDAVPNSIDNAKNVLVSGSNASGKSTFLKGIAISAILAQTIDTVPAIKYKAPVYRIYSSMSLRDDYKTKGSYYMVEIRALKRILDNSSDTQTPVLALVDEVLKGTNTIERISAASSILGYMADRDFNVFAATHDIELTELLSGVYRNCHFKETITDNDISFTYKLLEGPTTTRNAIALLKTLGYDQSITDEATERAERFLNTGEWK